MTNRTELTDRAIPGITWKQVVAFTIAVGTVVYFYFRIEGLAKEGLKQSKENGIVLKEMQTERKELVRVNDARLNNIELQIAECRLRITTIENQLNK